jgi:hypothetical protein
MRSERNFRGVAYFRDGTFFFVLDFADEVVAGLRALVLSATEDFEDVVECAVDCVFAPVVFVPVVDDLRRWLDETRCAITGSATWRRLPGSTLTPEILFQWRNWLSETPNRSAIVTSVSPLRTV